MHDAGGMMLRLSRHVIILVLVTSLTDLTNEDVILVSNSISWP